MNVCVLGAGSVGLGIAATLVDAGANVAVLARDEAVKRLRAEGISITGVLGEHVINFGYFSVEDVSSLLALACDLLIVTTKTYEVTPALKSVAGKIATPAVLLLQNGWGTADETRRIMPPETSIFSGILMVGLERLSPTHMHIHAFGDVTRVGSLFGEGKDKLKALFDVPKPGFIPFVWENEIEPIILTKLIYNICLNPLGALRRCTYGELMTNEETLFMMSQIADEGIKVLKAARGFSKFADGNAYVHDELVPKWLSKVGPHRSSMLQDLEAGRKTEIDYLNGAICAMGSQFAIETPHNEAIVLQIKAAELGGKYRKVEK